MPRHATRRPTPVEGQVVMTLGLLAERPGSQLDLIAEAGTETIGPSTTTTEADRLGRLF